MKVSSLTNAPSSADAKTNKKTAARNDLETEVADGSAAGALGEGEDFASVLERVTRSHDKPEYQERPKRGDDDSRGGRENDESSAPPERKPWQKDEHPETAQVSYADRHVTREARTTGETTPPDARAVLHVADLEKIVAACRAQVTPAGRHEVVIEMSRSVLEGLRVKVSADAAGRITTDFVAAGENVKALLDARAAELSDLLRARGVNLDALKTSVASGSGDQSHSQNGGQSAAQSRGEGVGPPARAGADSSAAGPGATSAAGNSPDGTTYRA